MPIGIAVDLSLAARLGKILYSMIPVGAVINGDIVSVLLCDLVKPAVILILRIALRHDSAVVDH